MSEDSYSRPTTPWGKATETIKTLVPCEVKEDFARKLRAAGYATESDALRELVILFTYGPGHMKRMHDQRIDRMAQSMAGITSEIGTE